MNTHTNTQARSHSLVILAALGAEVTLSATSTITSAPFMGQVLFCPTHRDLSEAPVCLPSFFCLRLFPANHSLVTPAPRYLELYLKVMFKDRDVDLKGSRIQLRYIKYVLFCRLILKCCVVCSAERQESSEQQGFTHPVGQRRLFNHHRL